MLTERQLFLFQLLVDDYIQTAEPVGSRTISKRNNVNHSSATIRNDLADLEDMGFIEKTHSSSGRVPSEKGYRYYVDHLLSPALLSQKEVYNIKHALADHFVEFEQLIQETAGILSEFSNYTSIVMGPELLDTKLKHIQIISIREDTAVMIVVTDTGHVENRTMTVPEGIQYSDLEKIVNILNRHLQGTPLYQLQVRVRTELQHVLSHQFHYYQKALSMVEDALGQQSIDKIYYGGKMNILSQPEFQDIDKVLPLLNALENKTFAQELLRPASDGMHIKIGHENDLLPLKDCSVITATYTIGGEHMGTVAVLGPTRMTYPRVVTLLDVVSNGLSNLLSQRYQND
ncbi:heat-inducible transcriptional repressor HrcA [Tuberibacillus sp. Marseille-P3662]|uniref:heat-inducible transcriptional repressor HrcA n=1 Tax=Tuberibacillus sp. Marseille-P3662 TaxID=1965358 RepID=UPI000A1CA46C|nr:heat-inducible transcriptional repressor HrcA [Tuberibacillus sp. Marseille-P3662]